MMTNVSQGKNANGRIILRIFNVKLSSSIVYSICCTSRFLLACDVHTDSLMKIVFPFCTAICCVYNVDLHLPFSPLFQLGNSVL